MRVYSVLALYLSVLSALLVTGCGIGPAAPPPESAIGIISGSAFGGRQPISGAHVYLLAANTIGYPTATYNNGTGITTYTNGSTSLLNNVSTGQFPTTLDTSGGTTNGFYYVTTNSLGNFDLQGDNMTCTVGQQIYMISLGGNPGVNGGSPVSNSAAALMAVLGPCPVTGTLAAAYPYVYMNEVSTVAAAYALSGFAVEAAHVGAPSLTDTLAAKGIANAFATAAQLYNIGNPAMVANTTTPGSVTGAVGTVPQAEIHSIANSLAACVNSIGPGSTACSTNLFNQIRSAGATGTTATDTVTEAIYIAHNPYVSAAAVSAVFGNSTPTPPYTGLSSAPSDFTITLSFTGGGLQPSAGGSPHSVGIDGSGNVWVVTGSDTTSLLSKFSPLGVPANPAGYANSLDIPSNVALTADSSQVWVANYLTPSSTSVVSVFNSDGSANTTYTTPGNRLQDVEFDGSGNAFVSSNGPDAIYKISSTGNLLATATISGDPASYYPTGISSQPGNAGNIWAADATDVYAFTNALGTYSSSPFTTGYASWTTPIDASGNVWVPSFADGSITKFTSAGTNPQTFISNTAGDGVTGSAIDGAGNMWMTSETAGVGLFELNSSGTMISPGGGYAGVSSASPDGMAIDGSGNIWYNDDNSATIYEVVGVAVPVATPLAYAVKNSLLGQLP